MKFFGQIIRPGKQGGVKPIKAVIDNMTGQLKRCVICGTVADIHHIKTRGASVKDKKEKAENKITLCRKHHTELHAVGRWSFAVKYGLVDRFRAVIGERKYSQWLKSKGDLK